MIVRDFYKTREDGVNLFLTYSDEGKMIIQNETGIEYAEAIDVENAPYTYSETSHDISKAEELSAEETLDIIVGGNISESEELSSEEALDIIVGGNT